MSKVLEIQKKCKKCGGTPNARTGKCNICEILGQGTAPGGTMTTGWPMQSEALACDRSQIDEHNARAKRHGIRVEYKYVGKHKVVVEIPDRNERRKLLRLEKYHDKDGGYGDG